MPVGLIGNLSSKSLLTLQFCYIYERKERTFYVLKDQNHELIPFSPWWRGPPAIMELCPVGDINWVKSHDFRQSRVRYAPLTFVKSTYLELSSLNVKFEFDNSSSWFYILTSDHREEKKKEELLMILFLLFCWIPRMSNKHTKPELCGTSSCGHLPEIRILFIKQKSIIFFSQFQSKESPMEC